MKHKMDDKMMTNEEKRQRSHKRGIILQVQRGRVCVCMLLQQEKRFCFKKLVSGLVWSCLAVQLFIQYVLFSL